ncbi:MAG TPA: hypothetical protein VK869_10135 [Rubrobacteraceae bacterium]|nr:hypothetical protein [Rubrobacteraceae bacterium]
MDNINKRVSRLLARLSSVGRVRLVIGLVVVLVLMWLVSPVFHGPVMALYVNWPFFLVVVIGAVLGVYLWRVGDKDPAKIVAVVATVAAVAYLFVSTPLRDLKYLDSIEAREIPEMPDTTGMRYLPYDVAARFGQNTQDDSTLVLGDFEPLDNGEGGIDWVAPREPNGPWNSLVNNQNGVMVIEPDGSAEIVDGEFRRGEGMALYRNVGWKLKRAKFFAHHTNQYYVLDGDELLGVVPYISYRFSFPVMVPRWGGVLVVHPDGEVENLSPEEAINDERFEGERLYPEELARKVGDVWKYRNGYWNTWFAHEDETRIPQISPPEEADAAEGQPATLQATSTNQMPFLIPTEDGPEWFSAAEPYGRSFSMYRGIYVDAHTGEVTYFRPETGSALIGVNKALDYAQATFPNYQWGQNAVILEPRPIVKDETLYWMATITNADKAGVNQTVMVNATEQGEVTVLETYEDVAAFIEGEDTGETVNVESGGSLETSEAPTAAPEAGTPEEQPPDSQSPVDVSDMSEEELIRIISEAANELENREE